MKTFLSILGLSFILAGATCSPERKVFVYEVARIANRTDLNLSLSYQLKGDDTFVGVEIPAQSALTIRFKTKIESDFGGNGSEFYYRPMQLQLEEDPLPFVVCDAVPSISYGGRMSESVWAEVDSDSAKGTMIIQVEECGQ